MYKYVFSYDPEPVEVVLTKKVLRDTLAKVRDMLLVGEINGGGKKLKMDTVCSVRPGKAKGCGMAACIGGWMGVLLAGHEQAHELFDRLIQVDRATDPKHDINGQDRLYELFSCYSRTTDFDEPDVAATAIQRYLDGKRTVWPQGIMPDKLRYKYRRKASLGFLRATA